MKRYYFLTTSIVSLLLSYGLTQESFAQRSTHFLPYSEVGFGVGTSSYYGDLSTYRQPLKATFLLMRWNAGLSYTRHFTPKLAARASFTWARIVGDDYTFNKGNPDKYPIQYTRNLHFRNDLKEFAITGIYQFRPDGRTPNNRARLTPYLLAGVALLAHSPQARTPDDPLNPGSSRKWVSLQPLNTEGQGQPGFAKPYSIVTVAIPVGLGIRYAINDDFNVAVEAGFRYTFTDYLDDAGGPYADPAALQGLAVTMADRRLETMDARTGKSRALIADPPTGFARGTKGILPDSYLLTSFQIHYIIPGKIKCPPIR